MGTKPAAVRDGEVETVSEIHLIVETDWTNAKVAQKLVYVLVQIFFGHGYTGCTGFTGVLGVLVILGVLGNSPNNNRNMFSKK